MSRGRAVQDAVRLCRSVGASERRQALRRGSGRARAVRRLPQALQLSVAPRLGAVSRPGDGALPSVARSQGLDLAHTGFPLRGRRARPRRRPPAHVGRARALLGRAAAAAHRRGRPERALHDAAFGADPTRRHQLPVQPGRAPGARPQPRGPARRPRPHGGEGGAGRRPRAAIDDARAATEAIARLFAERFGPGRDPQLGFEVVLDKLKAIEPNSATRLPRPEAHRTARSRRTSRPPHRPWARSGRATTSCGRSTSCSTTTRATSPRARCRCWCPGEAARPDELPRGDQGAGAGRPEGAADGRRRRRGDAPKQPKPSRSRAVDAAGPGCEVHRPEPGAARADRVRRRALRRREEDPAAVHHGRAGRPCRASRRSRWRRWPSASSSRSTSTTSTTA